MRFKRPMTKIGFVFGNHAQRIPPFGLGHIHTKFLETPAYFSGRIDIGDIQTLFIPLKPDRDEGNYSGELLFPGLKKESRVIPLFNLLYQHPKILSNTMMPVKPRKRGVGAPPPYQN